MLASAATARPGSVLVPGQPDRLTGDRPTLGDGGQRTVWCQRFAESSVRPRSAQVST